MLTVFASIVVWFRAIYIDMVTDIYDTTGFVKLVALHSLCTDIFTGLPPRLKATGAFTATNAIRMVGIRTITADGALNLGMLEEFHASSELPNSAQPLELGDVLLSIRGSLPKCAPVEEAFSQNTFASGNLAVLRPDSTQLDSSYLWSVLLRICHDEHHPLLTRATTQQLSIRISELSAVRIPQPSLDEQRAVGRAALALRNAVRTQRDALIQGERTMRAFLADSFPIQ